MAESAGKGARIGKGRLLLFSMLLLGLVLTVILGLGELLLRLVEPQPTMMPRYQFSPLYGHELPRSTVMVASQPGIYEFHYTINEYGYRGEPVPISNRYDRANIVVLGDSYSMGVGVEDEEVFSAVMANALEGCFDVVNLGVGGYGLTHQIRRFYEFGALYRPGIVVLQFFHNDPDDNVHDPVTVVEDGRFRFRATEQQTGWLKELLSDSFIQHSQVYNLLRNSAYRVMRRQRVGTAHAAPAPVSAGPVAADGGAASESDERERIHNELLELFARELHAQGISLVFIAVNHSLDRFPAVADKVLELDRQQALRYVEVADWFEGVSDFGSPEGHSWGAKAHRIIGENLSELIRSDFEPQLAPAGCRK